MIVLGINDGGKLEEPINAGRVKGIDWLQVYPIPRITSTITSLVKDPKSPYFGDFEKLDIQGITGAPFPVHRSRCLIFQGDPVPNTISSIGADYMYWGVSSLQSIWQQIKDLGAVSQSVANLMMEVIVGKYKLSNLVEMLSQNNTAALYTRMEIINASKSIINGVLLGEGEEYTRDTANLSGIPDVMDRFMMMLSAVSEIPMTRLFGRSPAGQNATGESDLTNYYDMVSSRQETQLQPQLQELVNLINLYTKVAKEPQVVFNSLWEPTQTETQVMKKQQAETDKTYIDAGVLTAEEVRASRFENGYSYETHIEGPAPKITGEE